MTGYDFDMLRVYKDFVEDRHLIWKKRQRGEAQPWTDDPILARQKFTNCFRVLDHGSQFLVKRLITDDPLDYIARCVFYRITNLPETWDVLRDELGRYPVANDFLHNPEALFQVMSEYRAAGNQVFSGAYIIVPAPGTAGDKVRDAIYLTQYFIDHPSEEFLKAETQQERFLAIQATPGLGKFLSMQILTDWGYGQDVNRENEFIVAGPGAVRGAKPLNPDLPAEMVIWDLATMWEGHPEVSVNGHPLGLMNVQNTLCEFSKYVRYRDKPPAKFRPYAPTHPGPQEEPTLPVWMEAL